MASSLPVSPGTLVKGVAVGAVAIIGLSAVLGCFYSIEDKERGLLFRNGAFVSVEEPGLKFKFPFIDDVKKISLETNLAQWKNVQAYSADQQAASMLMSVNWRYDPTMLREIYQRYGTNEDSFGIRVLGPQTMDKTKIVFGQYVAATAITNRGKMTDDIEAAIKAAVQGSGGIVESVQVENIDFSSEYEKSIEERMQAEIRVARLKQELDQDRVRADQARTQAQGIADAQRTAADAEAYRNKVIAAAAADATRLAGQAEADSIKARGESLKQNPLVIDLERTLKWTGTLPTHMIPGNAVPFVDLSR